MSNTLLRMNTIRTMRAAVAQQCASLPQLVGMRPYTEVGYRSDEYHRHSTRCHNSSREALKLLESSFAAVQSRHKPKYLGDKIAYRVVRILRWLSDVYFKRRLLYRACMLETVAAVPGIVAGLNMHLSSLRKMRHSYWIKTVMDEAENERMHLMTFMELLQPTTGQRVLLFAAQGAFFFSYFAAYIVARESCHRFVGYLEEEAVHTYTEFLKDIDNGSIPNVPAPEVAKRYWNMSDDATLRDCVLVIRADEQDHRDVNHEMSDIHSRAAYEVELGKERAANRVG